MKIFVLNVLGITLAALILMNGHRPVDLELGYVPLQVTLSKPTQFEMWAEAIAEFESNGDASVVNKFGMMGKYQFAPSTVAYLGFTETREEFLSRPHLQDSVFVMYYKANKAELHALIARFTGNTDRGFLITPAAILAGAHFAGARGVRKFLNREGNTVDANGTTLEYYMERFADYNLEDVE